MQVVETRIVAAKESRPNGQSSGDGLHFAWTVTEGDQTRLMVDGKPGRLWTKIIRYGLSDDGQHWACLAMDGKQYVLEVDGQAGERFDMIDPQEFKMNPR